MHDRCHMQDIEGFFMHIYRNILGYVCTNVCIPVNVYPNICSLIDLQNGRENNMMKLLCSIDYILHDIERFVMDIYRNICGYVCINVYIPAHV